MNKEDVLLLMINKFQEKNKELAIMSGMSNEEVNSHLENSKSSISFILFNVYKALEENDLLKNVDL